MRFRPVLPLVVVALLAGLPATASAQAFGIGPRLSFVRGDLPSGTPSTRFWGGIVRMQLSKRMVLEGAADYRSETAEDGLTRVKERPLQGSLLLFPVRSTLSPYVVGGYGVYNRSVEVIDETALLVPAVAVSERKTGLHLGFGAELMLGRRAAFIVDYRYRFVRFGSAESGEEAVNLPLLKDRLSHRGSMWTSGIAFYF